MWLVFHNLLRQNNVVEHNHHRTEHHLNCNPWRISVCTDSQLSRRNTDLWCIFQKLRVDFGRLLEVQVLRRLANKYHSTRTHRSTWLHFVLCILGSGCIRTTLRTCIRYIFQSIREEILLANHFEREPTQRTPSSTEIEVARPWHPAAPADLCTMSIV